MVVDLKIFLLTFPDFYTNFWFAFRQIQVNIVTSGESTLRSERFDSR